MQLIRFPCFMLLITIVDVYFLISDRLMAYFTNNAWNWWQRSTWWYSIRDSSTPTSGTAYFSENMLDKFFSYRREPWGLLKEAQPNMPALRSLDWSWWKSTTELILDSPIYVKANLSILQSRGDIHGLELCSSR